MATKKKRKSISIKRYKNRRELNLGIFLFAIVFLYLIVTVVMYLTDDTVSVYEVRKGSIVNDTSYTGLVLRQETAVSAESSGYVSYYQNENSKVKTGTKIYAVSREKLELGEQSENTGEGQPLNRRSSPALCTRSRIY